MSKEFDFQFEINGFGDSAEVEKRVRAMTVAGVKWFRENPAKLRDWDMRFHEFKKKNPNVQYEDKHRPRSWNADKECVMAAGGEDATDTQFWVSYAHARNIFTLGWDGYCRFIEESRKAAKREVEEYLKARRRECSREVDAFMKARTA